MWNRRIGRRTFLRIQGGCALTLGLGPLAPGIARAATPDLVIARGKAAAATRQAVEALGGMAAFVRPGNRVVIKPNMSFDSDASQGAVTNPAVVRQLVSLCRKAGASSVRVLDHTLRPAEQCLEGIRQVCTLFNDDIVAAPDRQRLYRKVPIPDALTLRSTAVMREVLDADVLIAAPTAKSHGSTGVSLSMKGMMGLIWSRGVMHSRHDLSLAITDLASLLKPALIVIDATWVLTTEGPAGPGHVLQADTIIAATDMVAADAQAVSLFPWYGRNMKPRQVKHIRLAHERGLGTMDLAQLAVREITV